MKEAGGTVLYPNYLQVVVCIKRFKDCANFDDCNLYFYCINCMLVLNSVPQCRLFKITVAMNRRLAYQQPLT
jgi:hypothetical protein